MDNMDIDRHGGEMDTKFIKKVWLKTYVFYLLLDIHHNDGVTKLKDNKDIVRRGEEMDSKII